ncbi:PilW family protein [Sphaerotilus sp.]|uniref:PilW family protein n=1 Tax=Sphaerotilus sp. TaxID=2093942 RepID=UPI00286EA8BC|nr:PilW family protein [Sphaerotilus sp.]
MTASPASPAAQSGVTLIELMVGMVIGLLAVLVIAQVTTVYEGRKRTITAGSDAQVNGALALQTLQRDVQTSGYGMSEGGATGCRIVGQRAGVATRFERTLAPVVITDGADGAADSLDVLMSNHADFALPTRVAGSHLRASNVFVIGNNTGLGHHKGDLMLAVPTPTPDPTDPARYCSLFNVSAEPVAASNQLFHDAGADGPWNQDLTNTVFPGTQSTDLSYAAGSLLLDLGTLVSRRFCVTGLAEARCDTPASQIPYQLRQISFDSGTGQTTADDLYPQIVQLQAVYGIDTSAIADQVADIWTAVSPTTAKGWQRVVAVRVAVVARSTQNEQRPTQSAVRTASEWVTPTLPVWYPDGVTAEPLRVDKAPPGAGDDWRNYRYKVFETVIPLRNLLWQPA